MRRDPRARLFDILEATGAIGEFTSGVEFDGYASNLMLRSAVERQLEIIGEALNLLSREDPAIGARIPAVHDVVAMRNVLIHGYDIVDHGVVWRTILEDLPRLSAVVTALLAELDAAAGPNPSVE